MPREASNAPLVWRLRHKLGAIAFYVALGFVLLGVWALIRSIIEGDWAGLGVGLTLIVGGALVMVGRKMRSARP